MKGETDNEEIDVREGDGERDEGSKYGWKKKSIKGKMKEEDRDRERGRLGRVAGMEGRGRAG